jgi:RNA polymerase sigma-70 factor (ECF subfamily)
MVIYEFSDQFVDLVTPHQSQLLGYLYAILRNSQDAEDVLQQTYLELWRKFDQYDPSQSFFGWARQFARIQAIQFLRKSRRHRLQFSSALIDLLADEILAEPQQYSQESARLRSLRACIGRLRESDQKLVRQCYRDHLTFRQIAEMLGRSPQSLGNSLRRIRITLLECIQRTLAAEERA